MLLVVDDGVDPLLPELAPKSTRHVLLAQSCHQPFLQLHKVQAFLVLWADVVAPTFDLDRLLGCDLCVVRGGGRNAGAGAGAVAVPDVMEVQLLGQGDVLRPVGEKRPDFFPTRLEVSKKPCIIREDFALGLSRLFEPESVVEILLGDPLPKAVAHYDTFPLLYYLVDLETAGPALELGLGIGVRQDQNSQKPSRRV